MTVNVEVAVLRLLPLKYVHGLGFRFKVVGRNKRPVACGLELPLVPIEVLSPCNCRVTLVAMLERNDAKTAERHKSTIRTVMKSCLRFLVFNLVFYLSVYDIFNMIFYLLACLSACLPVCLPVFWCFLVFNFEWPNYRPPWWRPGENLSSPSSAQQF